MATVELVFNLGSGRVEDSAVAGPQSESFLIERTAADELLGVHFAPGGAFPFIDCAFGDLHNGNFRLSDVFGETRATRLLERLHRTPTVPAKFRVLEGWLLANARRPLRHHPAVKFAMTEFRRDSGLGSSRAIAEKVNLSQGRFVRLFRDEVGLTPKLFSRLLRFNDVVLRIGRRDEVDWADLALSCGYFDQSHFNHDFRAFSGLSPTEYMDLRIRDHLGHVQVPD